MKINVLIISCILFSSCGFVALAAEGDCLAFALTQFDEASFFKENPQPGAAENTTDDYFYTSDDAPSAESWAGKHKSHAPVVAFNATSLVTVASVTHSQTDDVHYINEIHVSDPVSETCVATKQLNVSGEWAEPKLTFTWPTGVEALTVYEWCNLHGWWETVYNVGKDIFTHYSAVVASEGNMGAAENATDNYVYSASAMPSDEGWAGKLKSHEPKLTINETSKEYGITVTHSNSEEHLIEYVFALDQNGDVIPESFAWLTATDSPAGGAVTFKVSESVTSITAYEWCNLHGLWMSATYVIPVDDSTTTAATDASTTTAATDASTTTAATDASTTTAATGASTTSTKTEFSSSESLKPLFSVLAIVSFAFIKTALL